MPSTPTISVVLPAFNRVASIRAAVDSVLRQSFADFELLVVDDGSTDGTMAALAEVQDPRVRLLANPKNMGAGAARNTGIRHARGTWVAFQDSDDEWLPAKLDRQMAALAGQGADCVAGYCGMAVVGAGAGGAPDAGQGGRTRLHYIPEPEIRLVAGDILPSLLEHSLVSTQTLIARRDCLERIGGFDESLPALEDWDCAIRLAQLGPFSFVDAPLVHQHFSPNSITRHQGRRLAARQQIVAKHLDLLRQRPGLLALHYKTIAGEQRRLGEIGAARAALAEARRLQPFSPRLWAISAYLWLARPG
jgi:GT2 family glycosyltransferase